MCYNDFMADLIEKLKEIGLNTYEAKVYVALLKKYHATGYEVSKLADIPQSRTYDTLKALEKQNIVISTNTKPVTYTPIKPKQLIKNALLSLRGLNISCDIVVFNINEEEYSSTFVFLFSNFSESSGKDKIRKYVRQNLQAKMDSIISYAEEEKKDTPKEKAPETATENKDQGKTEEKPESENPPDEKKDDASKNGNNNLGGILAF